jgi:hypothetical protein
MKFAIMISLLLVILTVCPSTQSQTAPGGTRRFEKDGLQFEYGSGWKILDDSNSDAQQLTITRADSRAEIRLFVHRKRTTNEKMLDVRNSFIDTYIEATAKQFIAMGAKPRQSPDSTDIGSIKAEGIKIQAVLGGDPGAARIYWALIGQRVVLLTFFGPDRDLQKHADGWDLVRTTLRIEAS